LARVAGISNEAQVDRGDASLVLRRIFVGVDEGGSAGAVVVAALAFDARSALPHHARLASGRASDAHFVDAGRMISCGGVLHVGIGAGAHSGAIRVLVARVADLGVACEVLGVAALGGGFHVTAFRVSLEFLCHETV
jgi:hypothetical protein